MATRRGGARGFSRWAEEVTTKVAPEKALQLHQKIHIQLVDGLIADSPVGNPDLWESPPPKGYAGGRFRGNWQTSLGSPARGETGRIDPGGAETLSANIGALASLRPFGRSFAVNNVPYGPRLNSNPPHTKQIAPGWVQRNLQRVRLQFAAPFRRS